MENQTRFDLNHTLENWRGELAAQPVLSTDERRELEAHLQDAIAGFQKRGLTDEESFWLASRRTGQPQKLAEEFIKSDPGRVWHDRVFWAAIIMLVINLSSSLASAFVSLIDSLTIVGRNGGRPFWSMSLYMFLSNIGLVWLLLFLKKGSNSKIVAAEEYLFHSRRRFVFLTVAASIFCGPVLFITTVGANNFLSVPLFASAYAINWLLWPLTLICIIAWLMPKRKLRAA